MLEDIKKDAADRMSKCVASLKNDLKKLRTGRASTNLLEHLRVDYYGSEVPLQQVANVAVEDSRTLTVVPWEKQMVPVIEKAIMKSDLGLMPATAGTVIRVPLPSLTEERRRELTKMVRHEGEGARVAIRNVRRDVLQEMKEMLKEKLISEDVERKAHEGTLERGVALVDLLGSVTVQIVANDLEYPVATLTPSGRLVVADARECQVYGVLRGQLRLLASGPVQEDKPVAIVATDHVDRFALCNREGYISVWEFVAAK